MNHDVSECLFIEVEVVGHKNHHVTLLDRHFLFATVILKLPLSTIGIASPKKISYIWLCRSYWHSEIQRKTSFPFVFHSFNRNFAA